MSYREARRLAGCWWLGMIRLAASARVRLFAAENTWEREREALAAVYEKAVRRP